MTTMSEQLRCTRVTGKAFEPHYQTLPASRRGPRRRLDEGRRPGAPTEPVYDVLCGVSAKYWVKAEGVREIFHSCSTCLSAVVDEVTLLQEGGRGHRMVHVGLIETQPETQPEPEESFASRMGHPGGHYG